MAHRGLPVQFVWLGSVDHQAKGLQQGRDELAPDPREREAGRNEQRERESEGERPAPQRPRDQGRVDPSPAPGVRVDDFALFQSFLNYSGNGDLPEPQDAFTAALWQLRFGKLGDALTNIQPLYAANPENLWFSSVYTEVLEQMQRPLDAAEVYRQLLTIYPEHYYLSVRLIRVLQQLGQLDEALALARTQERLRPNNRSVLFALSSIYESMGKPWLSKFSQAEYQRLAGNKHQAVRLYDEILDSGEADQATELRAREQRDKLAK